MLEQCLSYRMNLTKIDVSVQQNKLDIGRCSPMFVLQCELDRGKHLLLSVLQGELDGLCE